MLHLRPLRSDARDVQEDDGPKDASRVDPLHAPPAVRDVFATARLVRVPSQSGAARLVKARPVRTGSVPPAGRRQP